MRVYGLTKNGPKIVEIAARLGGDFITSKLVPLSTEINMVEQSLNVVMEKMHKMQLMLLKMH